MDFDFDPRQAYVFGRHVHADRGAVAAADVDGVASAGPAVDARRLSLEKEREREKRGD